MMNRTEVRAPATDDEYEAMYRLRYEVYCRRMRWIPESDCLDGIEQDAHDEHAIHVIALEEGKVVGTIRLLRASEDGFPLESRFGRPSLEFIGIDAWDDRIGEVSRFTVGANGQAKHVVALGLMQVLYRASLRQGVAVWLTATDLAARRVVLDGFGFPESAFGEPAEYYGSTCVPGALNLDRLLRHLQLHRPSVHRFLAEDVPADRALAGAAAALAAGRG